MLNNIYKKNIYICFPATNLGAKSFMTPIGPLQLTAEECNEILMKRALQAQGITTPSVIDASQLNHTLLNGGIKTLVETPTQQTQPETIQTNTVHQHHLIHAKQEPGTANTSPKVSITFVFYFLFHSSLLVYE